MRDVFGLSVTSIAHRVRFYRSRGIMPPGQDLISGSPVNGIKMVTDDQGKVTEWCVNMRVDVLVG